MFVFVGIFTYLKNVLVQISKTVVIQIYQ